MVQRRQFTENPTFLKMTTRSAPPMKLRLSFHILLLNNPDVIYKFCLSWEKYRIHCVKNIRKRGARAEQSRGFLRASERKTWDSGSTSHWSCTSDTPAVYTL